MKRAPLFLLPLLSLAPLLAARAENPAMRFFRSALAFARDGRQPVPRSGDSRAGRPAGTLGRLLAIRDEFVRTRGLGAGRVRPAGAANDDPVWDDILDLAAAHFEEEVAVLRPPKPDAGPAVVRPTGLKSGDIRVIRKTGRVAP